MESDVKGYWGNGQWAAVEVGGGLGIWIFFPPSWAKVALGVTGESEFRF